MSYRKQRTGNFRTRPEGRFLIRRKMRAQEEKGSGTLSSQSSLDSYGSSSSSQTGPTIPKTTTDWVDAALELKHRLKIRVNAKRKGDSGSDKKSSPRRKERGNTLDSEDGGDFYDTKEKLRRLKTLSNKLIYKMRLLKRDIREMTKDNANDDDDEDDDLIDQELGNERTDLFDDFKRMSEKEKHTDNKDQILPSWQVKLNKLKKVYENKNRKRKILLHSETPSSKICESIEKLVRKLEQELKTRESEELINERTDMFDNFKRLSENEKSTDRKDQNLISWQNKLNKLKKVYEGKNRKRKILLHSETPSSKTCKSIEALLKKMVQDLKKRQSEILEKTNRLMSEKNSLKRKSKRNDRCKIDLRVKSSNSSDRLDSMARKLQSVAKMIDEPKKPTCDLMQSNFWQRLEAVQAQIPSFYMSSDHPRRNIAQRTEQEENEKSSNDREKIPEERAHNYHFVSNMAGQASSTVPQKNNYRFVQAKQWCFMNAVQSIRSDFQSYNKTIGKYGKLSSPKLKNNFEGELILHRR